MCVIMAATAADAGIYISGMLATRTDSEFRYDGKAVKNNDFTIFGQPVLPKLNFGDEIYLDLTVGYAFEMGLRLEVDVFQTTFRDKHADDGGINFLAEPRRVKLLYDIKTGTRFVPYVGAGGQKIALNGKNWDLDLVGVLGVYYNITDNVAIDLQYNRTWVYMSELGPAPVDKSFSNGINVFKIGARYTF